ncbi:MAG TPA: leucine-rich repeat domain-containing protein [Verrucomicrobiae bacterium]|nr:leucine-rich repeat domain-containing protein [Verrucomicrobiae bacterium]
MVRTKRKWKDAFFGLRLDCAAGLVAVLLALPTVVQAQTYTNSDGVWGYASNADGITLNITGYTGSNGSVSIPTNIDGLTVTSIADAAFDNCATLTNVTIGANVTNVGGNVFYDCSNLTAITVDSNNPAYSSMAGVLFDKSQTTLIQCPGGEAGSYAVPSTVTNIGGDAFFYCGGLASVALGNSVAGIGSLAFANCASLTNVTIGANVKSIGSGAFTSCTDLNAITVDSNNPAYSSVAGVLFDKSQTTLIQCPGGEAGSYMVPGSVTSIGGDAFTACPNLTSVTIGNNVTNIGVSAFSSCTSLTNVTIGANVTSIGVNAVYACPSLMTITVNSTNPAYSSVAGVLFNQNQTMLIAYPEAKTGSYVVPNSVTNIGANAFADCIYLAGVTIPNSVLSIGGGAFRYCLGLTSVTIPNSVTNIGFIAFANCPNLTGIYFQGNAPTPTNDSSVFSADSNGTVYYLPWTTGWGSTFDVRPTVAWNPLAQTGDAAFGVRTNRFGFNITGGSNLVVVVEACTNLANLSWSPISTNTLVNGAFYFSDSGWTNYPGRFYRFTMP